MSMGVCAAPCLIGAITTELNNLVLLKCFVGFLSFVYHFIKVCMALCCKWCPRVPIKPARGVHPQNPSMY
jgi:hypothetical protein